MLLDEPDMVVFKGEGGEAERRPHKSVVVHGLSGGERVEEDWPPILSDKDLDMDPSMDLSRLAAVWRGEDNDPYAHAAVIGTVAIVLRQRFSGRARW